MSPKLPYTIYRQTPHRPPSCPAGVQEGPWLVRCAHLTLLDHFRMEDDNEFGPECMSFATHCCLMLPLDVYIFILPPCWFFHIYVQLSDFRILPPYGCFTMLALSSATRKEGLEAGAKLLVPPCPSRPSHPMYNRPTTERRTNY